MTPEELAAFAAQVRVRAAPWRCKAAWPWLVWAALTTLPLAGCTSHVRLITDDTATRVRPSAVSMTPELRDLTDKTQDGGQTVVVPTGLLLQYHFVGVAPGGTPPATLSLLTSDIDFDNSGATTAGLLGIVGAPIYLSMADGYICEYSLLVEVLLPDGSRRTLAGRGAGRAKIDRDGALRDAVTQAVDDLHTKVDALLTPPPSNSELE